jgi:hypothetical protein
MAQVEAESSKNPIAGLLKPGSDWVKILNEGQLNLGDAREYLDNFSSEVAFLVFENRHTKDK